MNQVIIALDGGLGNQMFQYAAGRALALRSGARILLDARNIHAQGLRTYGLGEFALGGEISLLAAGKPPRNGRLGRMWAWLTGAPPTFREAGFPFDERISRLGADVRLEGYFQSERYFADATDVIRRDFTPRDTLRAQIETLADSLLPDGASVSIHVRRGDYASPAIMATHGLLAADYYDRALRLVAERAGATTPCVFTDDPAWVRAHLRLPTETRFISEHTQAPLQDLMLMSRCSHHITANSSFSWWGAWLDPSPNKVVVTPSQWFQATHGLDTRDLRPAGWLQT
jgi:hypothetical protein